MPFYEQGDVRIHYEEVGSGFPLLLIPGGGLNSTIAWNAQDAPFNPVEEFSNEYRCITADLRNAYSGQSAGPLDVERPWDAYADDQLGVMDHLGIKRFMVLGFCIGGPFIWNLLKRAPDRIVAAVASQPSGWRKELPHLSYETNMQGWGPEIAKRRPDISMEMVDRFLTRMDRVRWPDEIPGTGWQYDTDLTYLRPLVEYWRTPYDWRVHEARLNSFQQFTPPGHGLAAPGCSSESIHMTILAESCAGQTVGIDAYSIYVSLCLWAIRLGLLFSCVPARLQTEQLFDTTAGQAGSP